MMNMNVPEDEEDFYYKDFFGGCRVNTAYALKNNIEVVFNYVLIFVYLK